MKYKNIHEEELKNKVGNDKGKMNSKSDDASYIELIGELRRKLLVLADKIKPKVYEYGFLKE